uniref:Uncharacterized protein n=1 Tax=Acrobeloides nanus TaxID=290746 RepID=A0A914DMI6_9BILA
MNFARRSFLATTLAGQKDLPTAILLHQAMGPSTSRGLVSEAIPEESRCTSMQPEHDSSDSSLHASIPDIKSTP